MGIDPVIIPTQGLVIVPGDGASPFLPGTQSDLYETLVEFGRPDLAMALQEAVNYQGFPLDQQNPRRPTSGALVTFLTKVGFIPIYLGTAERSPSIEIVRGWLPWFDDELGSSLPADELYEAEEAWVTADVNRWNEPVYAFIAAVINRGPLGGARGQNYPSDVGTSMVHESFTYPLILQFPYAGKTLYQLYGMPAGYRFFNATLAGPDRLEPLGTEPSKRRLIWRCREYLDLESQAMALYDNYAAVGGIN